jgi:tropomyosin
LKELNTALTKRDKTIEELKKRIMELEAQGGFNPDVKDKKKMPKNEAERMEMSLIQRENHDLQKEVEELRDKEKDLVDEIQRLKQQNSDLSDVLNPMKHDKNRFYQKFFEQEKKNEMLENKVTSLMDDNLNLKRVLERKNEGMLILLLYFSYFMKLCIPYLTIKLLFLCFLNFQIYKQNIIKDDLNIREQAEETIENLENENKNLKDQNNEMRKTMAGLRGSLKAYERRDMDKERELNMMGKKMGDLMSAESLKKNLIEREHRIKELETLNLENEKLLQTFEEELEKKSKRIEDLEYQNGSKTEEIHELKYKLNEYRKKFEKYTTIEKKINILMMENKSMKEELASKPKQVVQAPMEDRDDYEEQINNLELQIENLKDLIKKLKVENENWRKKYEELKSRMEYWEKQRDDALEKCSKMEYRLEDKTKECDEKTMLNGKLMTKVFIMIWELKSKERL